MKPEMVSVVVLLKSGEMGRQSWLHLRIHMRSMVRNQSLLL